MIKTRYLASISMLAAFVLAGCSGGKESDGGGRIAPSLEVLYEQALERDDLSNWDRAALEKAREQGKIAQADYVEGMDLFDACLKDQGIEFTRTTLLNGVIEFQPPDGQYSDAEIDAQGKALYECSSSINEVTQELFRMQQANPDLLTDFPQAGVNCLQKAGVVGDDFTKDDFNKLFGSGRSESESSPVDVMDTRVQTCLYSLGYALKVSDE